MLYHFKTGLPTNLTLPPVLKLLYSRHAQSAALSDRYGLIELENFFDTEGAYIVEMETDLNDARPIKIVVRRPYNHKADICLAIALDSKVGDAYVVKTVWLNLKSDKHVSLDHRKYKRLKEAV